MEQINEKPVIVKINEGEIINNVTALNKKTVSIDLFNSRLDGFKNQLLKWNGKNFSIGEFVPIESTFDLNNCIEDNVIYLNGDKAEELLGYSLIVGTHIGEEKPAEDLFKRHRIKCGEYEVDAKFDFIYVQVTTGVSEDFGEEKYRKSSENRQITPKELKKLCDSHGVKLGFSHYLTGYPLENGKTAQDIGRDQARKFLKAIVGSEDEIADPTVLTDGLIPMVIFMDNITQPGYYGAAPNGVKKELENI